MRRLNVIVLGLLAALALPQIAQAQAVAGDLEILTFANITSVSQDEFRTTSGNIFVNVGVFMTDRFEVGGGPTISISRTTFGDFTDSDIGVGVNGFVRYFFGQSSATLKPYVGGEVFIQELNTDEGESVGDTTFASGVAGLKNYLSENAAIDFKGSFGMNVTAPEFGGRPKIFTFTVGLSFTF